MSNYTSPPPYQPYDSIPRTLHGHTRTTSRAQTLGCESQIYGHNPRPCQDIRITVPTSSTSETVIRQVYRSRYNETYPLLTKRRRGVSHHDSECCFCTTLGVVLILAFFAIIFVSFMPRVNDEFTWTNFESHSCTTYATREYVAELNVSSWNRHRMEICMATSADVHGRLYWPSSCEVHSGKLIGHFAVNHDEPDCVTYWSRYRDRGCTARGSKKRHIEQHLMNVPHRADYKEFCATTPARFLDREFSGADSCGSSIWGVYGHWFIDDGNC